MLNSGRVGKSPHVISGWGGVLNSVGGRVTCWGILEKFDAAPPITNPTSGGHMHGRRIKGLPFGGRVAVFVLVMRAFSSLSHDIFWLCMAFSGRDG